MGDWLRRLLYPLVLPVLVGTVWLCGWVRQQDDRARGGRMSLPPAIRVDAWPTADPAEPRPPAARPRTDFFAAADSEEAAE